MTSREIQVRVAVLRHALRARPVNPASLSAVTGQTTSEVHVALAALHEAGAIYLADGTTRAAYPFSFKPTIHRVVIGGATLYANCAVDALAMPPMCEEAAEVSSECGLCGGTITVTMHGDRVLGTQPAAPVVFYPSSDCCAEGPAILTRCPYINFFCNRDHSMRWQAAHPEQHGTVLTLGEATAFAYAHFASVIRSVRSGDAARREPPA